MADRTPMPGPSEFSADQEKAMRQSSPRRIAPAPSPEKIERMMEVEPSAPGRIGPDDAMDDQ
jgi:hypothetical protein